MLDRRTFLRRLGYGTVAAAVAASPLVDLDRLLWVPGERTIFLPSAAHTFITPDWVTRDVLRYFMQNIRVSRAVFGQYDAPFMAGASLAVRLPQQVRPQ